MMNENELISEYLSQVSKAFPSIEMHRKKKLKTTLIFEFFIIFVTSLYGYCLFNYYNYLEKISSDLAALAIIVFWVFVLITLFAPICANDEFRYELKKIYVPQIIKCIGEFKSCNRKKIYMNEKEIFSPNELAESTLFGRFNSIETDDSFFGKYKGTDFKISELKLSLNGKKYYSSVFKGVVITFDMNKTVNAKTLISTSGDLPSGNSLPVMIYLIVAMPVLISIFFIVKDTTIGFDYFLKMLIPNIVMTGSLFFFAFFINRFLTKKYNANNKKIDLEDVVFRKKFRVYSEDEVEAKNIITPAFMEKFLNLTSVFGTKKAKCAFYGDKIMFAISARKNLFELGTLFKSFSADDSVKFFKEFTSILDMISYFKSDEDTKL